MKTESVIISGVDTARRVASALVDEAIWFSVDPLPDHRFVVTVKSEDLDRVIARLRTPAKGNASDLKGEPTTSADPTGSD